MWKDIDRTIGAVGIALVALAIFEELRKQPEVRTWTGKLFGFVPYDLRFPTLERFGDRLWNPADPRVIVEHPFGVGWTVNFASLIEAGQGLVERLREPPAETVDQKPVSGSAGLSRV